MCKPARFFSVSAMAIAFLSGATLIAQSSKPAPTELTADELFVRNAGSVDKSEVKLGQLAEQKATSDAVRSFAMRMVDDHTQADDKLNAAAFESNLKVPSRLTKRQEATYDHLSKLSGPAFDRAYAKDMVAEHLRDIANFRKEASSGDVAALKMFATNTLPTLQDHSKQARAMENTVSAAARYSAKVNHTS